MKDATRGLLANVRDEESRRVSLLEEKCIATVFEADPEQNRMKQTMLEQKIAAESMRMHTCAELSMSTEKPSQRQKHRMPLARGHCAPPAVGFPAAWVGLGCTVLQAASGVWQNLRPRPHM